MIETVKLSPVFSNWEKTESIIRKNLDGQISEGQEDEILSRLKEIYDRLPSQITEIHLRMDGLEQLSEQEVDRVYCAVGSAVDQVEQQMQALAGRVLGEIFALVVEVSRTEARQGYAILA